jgi:hypothetical protein
VSPKSAPMKRIGRRWPAVDVSSGQELVETPARLKVDVLDLFAVQPLKHKNTAPAPKRKRGGSRVQGDKIVA